MKGLTFERLFWPTTRIAFFTIVLLVGFQFASVPSETRATALCFIPVLLLVWIPFWDAHRSARHCDVCGMVRPRDKNSAAVMVARAGFCPADAEGVSPEPAAAREPAA